MTRYRLGVLAVYLPGRKLEELPFFHKLSVYGQKLGIDVLVFTPDDVTGSKVRALYYHAPTGNWRRKLSAVPELVYDRCRYRGVENFQKVTSFRSQFNKVLYLNRPLANKWSVHQILSEKAEISAHLPTTVLYSGKKEMLLFLKQHRRIYLKPRNGTGGRGIVSLQSLSDSLYLLQGRDQNRRIIRAQKIRKPQIHARLNGWNLDGQYIIQQGIPLTLKDGRVHDFRMLIQKNGKGQWRITGCAGRVGPKDSVTSNLHGGGTAVPMDFLLIQRFDTQEKVDAIKAEAYKLGMRTAEYLEEKFGPLCELGIDLAVDPKGKVWLLEVNPKPSREVFHLIGERNNYTKAIIRPLQYALHLFKNKAEQFED